jgi:hypothetical protein
MHVDANGTFHRDKPITHDTIIAALINALCDLGDSAWEPYKDPNKPDAPTPPPVRQVTQMVPTVTLRERGHPARTPRLSIQVDQYFCRVQLAQTVLTNLTHPTRCAMMQPLFIDFHQRYEDHPPAVVQ